MDRQKPSLALQEAFIFWRCVAIGAVVQWMATIFAA
jgi:hypothetical protein